MVKICPEAFGESSSSLYQVSLAAESVSLLQLRVTELPSMISPGGFTDTDGSFRKSAGENINMCFLSSHVVLDSSV